MKRVMWAAAIALAGCGGSGDGSSLFGQGSSGGAQAASGGAHAGDGGPGATGGSSASGGATAAQGCAKDTDCKGDRICVDGKCQGASGGAGGSGGSGGRSGSGGRASGGATSSGGTATGGIASSGGTSSGGAQASGGTTSSGGTSSSGGTTATGGTSAVPACAARCPELKDSFTLTVSNPDGSVGIKTADGHQLLCTVVWENPSDALSCSALDAQMTGVINGLGRLTDAVCWKHGGAIGNIGVLFDGYSPSSYESNCGFDCTVVTVGSPCITPP